MNPLRCIVRRARSLAERWLYKRIRGCALCGALPYPEGGRLCVSLPPAFGVDAVVIPEDSAPGYDAGRLDALLDDLERHAAFLSRIHLWPAALPAGWKPGGGTAFRGKIRLLSTPAAVAEGEGARIDGPALWSLGGQAGVGQHFLLAPEHVRIDEPVLIADFFTANGLPFLPCRPPPAPDEAPDEGAAPGLSPAGWAAMRRGLRSAGLAPEPRLVPDIGIHALTKAILREAAPCFVAFPPPDRAWPAILHLLAQWAYARRRGVARYAPAAIRARARRGA